MTDIPREKGLAPADDEGLSIPVLTLWQPWASLVALGVKRIETRSWSTTYRGPIAIHAAATTKGFDSIAGGEEAGWVYGEIGDFQAAYCRRTSDEGQRGDTYLHCVDGPNATTNPGPCPLGAIVAVAQLVDVVPMVDADSDFTVRGDDVRPPLIDVHGIGVPSRLTLWWPPDYWHNESDELDVTDQEPYGDFQPGRFGWLLHDIRPLDAPVPFTGGQGLTRKVAAGALR